MLEQNSDILVGKFLKVSPLMKRQFVSALRTTRQSKIVVPEVVTNNDVMIQDLFFVEDDDEDTTGLENSLKLGIKIDSPSQSIFTLGNSTKQRGLGIITMYLFKMVALLLFQEA